MAKIFIITILFNFIQITNAQEIEIGNPIFVSDSTFLSIESPNWSPDGNSLVFSAFINDKWSLFIYKLYEDTLIGYSQIDYNIRKPVWHTNGNSLVCDKIDGEYHRLILFRPETLEVKELLNREICSSNASFSTNPDLMCFLGFDKITETWQVYTYDFIYDNLNKITHNSTSCNNPCFSPDGKHILYEQISETFDTSLVMVNWYGNIEIKFDTIKSFSPSWSAGSWRFYFIGSSSEHGREVFSLRKNGEALLKVTDNNLLEKDFLISPNAEFAAVILEEKNRKKLMIINMPQ